MFFISQRLEHEVRSCVPENKPEPKDQRSGDDSKPPNPMSGAHPCPNWSNQRLSMARFQIKVSWLRRPELCSPRIACSSRRSRIERRDKGPSSTVAETQGFHSLLNHSPIGTENPIFGRSRNP